VVEAGSIKKRVKNGIFSLKMRFVAILTSSELVGAFFVPNTTFAAQ
jgi:hypothetical protein